MLYCWSPAGGWSLLNIPGDGTTWGINSTQFIKEKRVGNPAFYSISLEPDNSLTELIIAVHCACICMCLCVHVWCVECVLVCVCVCVFESGCVRVGMGVGM